MENEFYKWFASDKFDGRYNQKSAKAGFKAGYQAGRAAERAEINQKENAMNEEQIKHMVNRFLQWKLPENFHPDAGINFKPTFNDHLPQPTRYEPSGTNLFDATQAKEMVEFMLVGISSASREEIYQQYRAEIVAKLEELESSMALWHIDEAIEMLVDTGARLLEERGDPEEDDFQDRDLYERALRNIENAKKIIDTILEVI
jgi:hypothetical protein